MSCHSGSLDNTTPNTLPWTESTFDLKRTIASLSLFHLVTSQADVNIGLLSCCIFWCTSFCLKRVLRICFLKCNLKHISLITYSSEWHELFVTDVNGIETTASNMMHGKMEFHCIFFYYNSKRFNLPTF